MTSSRLRVLYFINGLGTGGAERSIADLLEPLEHRGIDIVFACLYERHEGVQDEMGSSIEINHLGERLLQRLRNAKSVIREASPHVIHTTIFESDLLGRVSAIGTGIPVVTSIVNTSYSREAALATGISSWKLEAARLVDGLSARHLNAGFHAITHVAKAEAVRALGIDASSITVIPRGRDASRLGIRTRERRLNCRHSMGLGQEQPVLLSVGRREHQKGQIFAVQALARLRPKFDDVVLLIAGRDGSASGELNRIVNELQLNESVRFLGHRADVPDLMVAADALVFPSRYEGLGGTVIEAMALELPVVTSDIPVLREVAGDAALFAPVGSPELLAEKVAGVLSDSALAMRLARGGKNRFASHFDIDGVADQMAHFYQRVASG